MASFEILDSVIVGDSNQPEIDEDTIILDSYPVEASKQAQANKKDCEKGIERGVSVLDFIVVEGLNCAEVSGDQMLLDNSPIESSKQSQGNKKDCEKGIEEGGLLVVDIVSVEGLDCPEVNGDAVLLDSSPFEASKQSQINENFCEKGIEKGGILVCDRNPMEDLNFPEVNGDAVVPIVNLNHPEVNGDTMVLGSFVEASIQSQENEKVFEKAIAKGGVLVLDSVPLENLNCPEVNGDTMILDSSPVEVPKQSQPNEKGFEKAIEKEGDLVLDRVPMEDLDQPEVSGSTVILYDTVESSKQLQTDVKDHEKRVEKLGVVVPKKVPAEDLSCLGVHANTVSLDNLPTKELKQSQGVKDHEKRLGKPLKRKRPTIDGNLICRDKESLVTECRQQLDDLVEYYKEFSVPKLNYEITCSSNNSLIACLLEESNLPFCKLVEEVYEKLKAREGITLASVRSAVLSVGQRMAYGITNADADVLEDKSDSCLWCWETRNIKWLPKTQRGILNVRRIARKKIHERISALSDTMSALSVPESQDSYKTDLIKASVKLGKALNGEEIRSLVEKLKLKNDAEMAKRETKLKEKEFVKELERNMRNAEKETERIEHEIRKEKQQSEKELKQLQEAEKEERRHEKEEAELKKQLKRQQEEAERDQRRREKAEAELKKQLAIQKQAAIMERFLKRKKSNGNSDNAGKRPSMKDSLSDSSRKEVVNATTSSMDCVFSLQESLATEDIRKLHIASWHKLSHCNRSCHWGVRRNPKIEMFKDLTLQGSSSEAEPHEKVRTPNKGVASFKVNYSREPSLDKLVDGLEESFADNLVIASPSIQLLRKKLLQFDKSHRPAYYGTWHMKSGVISPRHPFRKDPDLDYDVDSDEEWEEEEPGESLSDCDKDTEEEHLEEENSKVQDEDESEDDFVVPDGYLSENEGVQVDGSSDSLEDGARSSLCCKPEVESDDISAFLQQQKYLRNLTEQALQKGHSLAILNLMHEKSELMAEDLNGTSKLEQICLQALSMRACPGGSIIDISINQSPSNRNRVLQSLSESISLPTATATAATIPDSDLLEFVRSTRSNPFRINKVVASLQHKFPTTPKPQLRSKVREISDFVDNRWQVKKGLLEKLGLSTFPEKDQRPKGIATYFSKRCLPPKGKSINISETSPQPCSKTKSLLGDGGHCSYIDM